MQGVLRARYTDGRITMGCPVEELRDRLAQFPDMWFTELQWESYAWPGGYQITYVVKDGGLLCPRCANEHLFRTLDPEEDQWFIVDSFIHWEGPTLWCDHCNKEIESEYGDPDDPGENNPDEEEA